MSNFSFTFFHNYSSHYAAYEKATSYFDGAIQWLNKLNKPGDIDLPSHLSEFNNVKLSGEKANKIETYIFDDKFLRNKSKLNERTRNVCNDLDKVNANLQENQTLGGKTSDLRIQLADFRDKLDNQELIVLCSRIENYLMDLGAILASVDNRLLYSKGGLDKFTECIFGIRETIGNINQNQFLKNPPQSLTELQRIQLKQNVKTFCFLIEQFTNDFETQIDSNKKLSKRIEDLIQEITNLREDISVTNSWAFGGSVILGLFLFVFIATTIVNSVQGHARKVAQEKECNSQIIPSQLPLNRKILNEMADNCLNAYTKSNDLETVKFAGQYYKQLKDDNNNDLRSFFLSDYTRNLTNSDNNYDKSIETLGKLDSINALKTIEKEQFDVIIALAYIMQSQKNQAQNHEKIETYYDTILERDPQNVGARFGKCNSHFGKEKAELIEKNRNACTKLVEDLEEELKRGSNSRKRDLRNLEWQTSQAYSSLGCILVRLGKYKTANQYFATAMEKTMQNNGNPSDIFKLIRFYSLILEKDYDEAKKYYEKLSKSQGITHIGLGNRTEVDYQERKNRFSIAKLRLERAGDKGLIKIYGKPVEACMKDPSLCNDLLKNREYIAHMHSRIIAYTTHLEINGVVRMAIEDFESKRKKSNNSLQGRACTLVEDYER
jgi:tetratricopeptide (TPR) repeat protein